MCSLSVCAFFFFTPALLFPLFLPCLCVERGMGVMPSHRQRYLSFNPLSSLSSLEDRQRGGERDSVTACLLVAKNCLI